MKKFLLGFVAATAVATPIALTAGSASAATISTDPACSPVKDVAAWNETLYKYVPVKSSDGPTQWDTKDAPAGTHKTWTVKGKDVDYVRDGNKANIIQHPAIEGVTCSVTLPEHFEGEGTYSVVVPFVKGVDTFLLGVQGHDEKIAITQDVTVTKEMAGQFWIGHQAQEGYVIANPDTAQWHIDFQFAYDGSTAVNAQGVGTVGKATVGDMNTANIQFVGGYVNETDNAWSCSDGSTGPAVRTVTSTRPIAATPKTDWHGNVLGWSLNGFSTTDPGTVVGTGPRFATGECPAGSSLTGLLTPAITHVNYVKVTDGTNTIDLPISAA
jgi:hypothetical protein